MSMGGCHSMDMDAMDEWFLSLCSPFCTLFFWKDFVLPVTVAAAATIAIAFAIAHAARVPCPILLWALPQHTLPRQRRASPCNSGPPTPHSGKVSDAVRARCVHWGCSVARFSQFRGRCVRLAARNVHGMHARLVFACATSFVMFPFWLACTLLSLSRLLHRLRVSSSKVDHFLEQLFQYLTWCARGARTPPLCTAARRMPPAQGLNGGGSGGPRGSYNGGCR